MLPQRQLGRVSSNRQERHPLLMKRKGMKVENRNAKERKRKKCFPTPEKIDQQNLLITMLLEVEEYHSEEDNRDSTIWSPNRESKISNHDYKTLNNDVKLRINNFKKPKF